MSRLNIDKRAIDPKTGKIFRNPSHIDAGNDADNQREIVESINKAQRKREVVQYSYEDKQDFKKLPGMFHLRTMNKDQLEGFFKALLRSHPNTIGIHLRLGDYPGARLYNGSGLDPLNSSKRRFTGELAEKFATLFAEAKIVELRYSIDAIDPGNFIMSTEAAVVGEEEYDNDELFQPSLAVEFIRPA